MDLFSNLALGFETALTASNLLFCFIGVFLGTAIGVLPGVGPTAAIAMLLPVTYSLSAEASLIMLAGIYYGTQYGGSTTAILINLPGESSSVVTAIDGYQMARQGRAGPALAIAAIGSFAAGSVAILIIALLAAPLTSVALRFGPAEYFSLILLGLVASITLAHGSIFKAVGMIVFGLLAGMVGTDLNSATTRFTFGSLSLADGLNVVAIAVGLFGIPEILTKFEDETNRTVIVRKVTSLMPSRSELKASAKAILRGTALGSFLGVLPGGGAMLSSFASYALEKRISRSPERFGHGAIEGVAGPEAANNAGAQTSFIPMLTLGIPSNAVMAIMVGAMIIQGIVPGPNVISANPELFWGLVASMWIGNVMLLVLNLPLLGMWVKLLTVPHHVLVPIIVTFSTIGVFSINNNLVDLFSLAGFGLLGYVLIRLRFEAAPFLLGFILGPLFEENLRRTMLISQGDPTVFLTSPISAILIGISVVMLMLVCLPSVASKREEVFVDET
jgi:TctA family transporter